MLPKTVLSTEQLLSVVGYLVPASWWQHENTPICVMPAPSMCNRSNTIPFAFAVASSVNPVAEFP